MSVKRGEIYYADLSPVIGSEQGGVRPVLIIQNDVGNIGCIQDGINYSKVDEIEFCNLTSKDVVRHPLVQKIVKAYEEYESGVTAETEGTASEKAFLGFAASEACKNAAGLYA